MAEDRVGGLRAIADRLADCTSREEICWCVVESVDRVISFEAAVVVEDDGDELRPLAVASDGLYPAPYLDSRAGIAGEAIRTGEGRVVDDLCEVSEAAPTHESFRSALTVPVDDAVAFQALSTDVGAFSERDREAAELLARQVGTALTRADYESGLQHERDKFAALFENVPEPALQYERSDGRIVVEAVNSAFVRAFGYDSRETVGRPLVDLVAPDESDAAETDLVDQGYRAQREVERSTDEGQRRFLLQNVPVDVDQGLGYLIYTDVEEARRREEQLREQNERLDEFASVVSHDLRNPLEVAQGYLTVAEDHGDRPEFEHIGDSLDRMERIIDDVLTMAREGDVVDARLVDLEQIATAAWDNVVTDDLELTVAGTYQFDADPDKLTQLMENLIRNASEHAGEDVEVRVGVLGDERGFFVADDGRGIPPETREEVFDSGYSTDQDGTGLGLAVVERIVRAHDWSVSVTDSESGGARFEVVIEAD